MPRRTFGNEVKTFCKTLDRFSDLVAILSEIVSGKRHPPLMLNASTSDPTIILSTIVEVAAPLVALYKDVLEIIIKSLEVAKAFGILREVGASPSPIPDVVGKALKTSVDSLIEEHGQVADSGRRHQLQAELLLRVTEVIPTIQAGGRLSIAVTNTENTTTRIVGADGTADTLNKQSEITQTLEVHLAALAAEPVQQIQHQDKSPPAL